MNMQQPTKKDLSNVKYSLVLDKPVSDQALTSLIDDAVEKSIERMGYKFSQVAIDILTVDEKKNSQGKIAVSGTADTTIYNFSIGGKMNGKQSVKNGTKSHKASQQKNHSTVNHSAKGKETKMNTKKANGKKRVKTQVKKVVKAVQPKKQTAPVVQEALRAIAANKHTIVATKKQLRLAIKRERGLSKGLTAKTATKQRINQLANARIEVEELKDKLTGAHKNQKTLVANLRKARAQAQADARKGKEEAQAARRALIEKAKLEKLAAKQQKVEAKNQKIHDRKLKNNWQHAKQVYFNKAQLKKLVAKVNGQMAKGLNPTEEKIALKLATRLAKYPTKSLPRRIRRFLMNLYVGQALVQAVTEAKGWK